MIKRIVIAVCIASGTLLALVLYWPGMRPQPQHTVAVGAAAVGGPFSLVDTKGNRVTQDILNGHYSLVYFGYTNCPDICPLALHNITEALERAGPVADTVLPVFITVDPERDTPQALGQYIANFHPRFIALTGTPDEVKAATEGFRVYAAKDRLTKGGANASTSDYTIDHSDFIYLLDPNGHYVTHFDRDVAPQDIANRLRRELNPTQ